MSSLASKDIADLLDAVGAGARLGLFDEVRERQLRSALYRWQPPTIELHLGLDADRSYVLAVDGRTVAAATPAAALRLWVCVAAQVTGVEAPPLEVIFAGTAPQVIALRAMVRAASWLAPFSSDLADVAASATTRGGQLSFASPAIRRVRVALSPDLLARAAFTLAAWAYIAEHDAPR